MSQNLKNKTIIIAGGGTGGHLFPGLALAESFKDSGYEVHFVGTKQGLEYKVIPSENYKLHTIPVKGLKRAGILSKLLGLMILPLSFIKSLGILHKIKPKIVIGVGGYASGPMVLTASLLGYPTAILEQNTVPGITNKILGKRVNKIYVSFKESINFFPSNKTVLAGNPVRKKIRKNIELSKKQDSNNFHLLIFGGSQGAHAINELIKESSPILLENNISIRHQCGKYDYKNLKNYYTKNNLNIDLQEFISDMANAYGWADLVICRAGATTIAELRLAGKPAIFIPFPYATDNHQEKNARSLEKEGAAICMLQSETTGKKLSQQVIDLLNNNNKLKQMSKIMQNKDFENAADFIKNDLISLSNNKLKL